MLGRSICRIKHTPITSAILGRQSILQTRLCRTLFSNAPISTYTFNSVLLRHGTRYRASTHSPYELSQSIFANLQPFQQPFTHRSYSTDEKPSSQQPTPSSPESSNQTISPNSSSPESSRISSATLRENIYTLPNYITVSRILSCPVLGWSIVTGNFPLATGLVIYAGFTDWLDGFLARSYNMRSVMGTILDPAADKALMTTLTISLAVKGLLPIPLAVIILGRDVLLSLSAFWYRYISLPPPKTFMRYWDFSIPSAEVRPTMISKVNTVLQLLLMTATVFDQVIPYDFGIYLEALQWIVGGTTIWSGLSYVFSKNAVRILSNSKKLPPKL
ncbi:hypothetical protein FRC02_009784 [Tulasnella sp. 418]|nr:hypothetical protein FRC02_009784 [Tulasnella sp. 418]